MEFTVVNVFRRCLSDMRKGFIPLLAVTVLSQGGKELVSFGLSRIPSPVLGSNIGLFDVVAFLIACGCMSLHWCAVTQIVLLTAADEPVRIDIVLRHSARLAVPVLILGILVQLATMAGIAVMIVPGFVFMAMSAVAVPAFINDAPGMIGAFVRSQALTKGNRWRVFWVCLLVDAAVYGAFFQGGAVLEYTSFQLAGAWAVPVSMAIDAMTAPYVLCMWAVMAVLPALNTSIYVMLRLDKGEMIDGAVEKVFE